MDQTIKTLDVLDSLTLVKNLQAVRDSMRDFPLDTLVYSKHGTTTLGEYLKKVEREKSDGNR